MKEYKVSEGGYSTIKKIGIMAAVGVVLFSCFFGYSEYMTKSKTNRLIEQISTIAKNAKKQFPKGEAYTGLTNTTAFQLKLFPEDMVKNCNAEDFKTGCVKHVFGGKTIVGYMPADEVYLSIQVNSPISKAACVSLVTADWGPEFYSFRVVSSGSHDVVNSSSKAFNYVEESCSDIIKYVILYFR